MLRDWYKVKLLLGKGKHIDLPQILPMFSMSRFTTHVVGSVMFMLTFAVIVVAHAANIAGHRAFYEMRMGQVDKNAVVQSVSGRSALFLKRIVMVGDLPKIT